MNSTNTDFLHRAAAGLRYALLGLILPAAFSLSATLSAAEAPNAAAGTQTRRSATAKPSRRQAIRPQKQVKKSPRRAADSRAAIAPGKVNNLLYGTMERLETLSSIYENLGLRVSTGTLKKVLALNSAVNSASAVYFGPGQKPARESSKTYSGLLQSALRSLRILKELKNHLKPAATKTALLAARDLYQAIGSDLAGPGLIPVPAEPVLRATAETATALTEASTPFGGEELVNETATLVAISEVTFAISAFRKEEGRFPGKLKDLVPKYIPALPTVAIAGHPATNKTTDIDSADYDANLPKILKDTGAWVYFSNKKSQYYGRVFVDCTHKNAQGVAFYRIGAGL